MTTSPAYRELPRFLFGTLFIALLVLACLWILRPFLPALVWAALIVASTWELMLAVQRRLGGRRSLAVTAMTILLLLVFVLPLVASVLTIADHADDVAERLKEVAEVGVPGPPAWVDHVPLVGRRLAARWQEVADLPADELHARAAPYLKGAAAWIIHKAGGLATFFLHLLLTVILSALLYAHGESAAAGVRAFAIRLAGARGDQSVTLGGQAIRAVALGVLVTAVIQSALGGIGLVLAGVPFAGFLTSIMFVLAVAQIGAMPILLLAVIWVYSNSDTLTFMLFMPYAVFVAILDNVLRPVLIKRGADLPLVLVFAGVIGGLLAFGVVGLFVGPVLLAIAYTQLSAWVNDGEAPPEQLPLPLPQAVTSQPARVTSP